MLLEEQHESPAIVAELARRALHICLSHFTAQYQLAALQCIQTVFSVFFCEALQEALLIAIIHRE